MSSDDDHAVLSPQSSLDANERRPERRACERCGKSQVLSGYADFEYTTKTLRFWKYVPGECACWEVVDDLEIIQRD